MNRLSAILLVSGLWPALAWSKPIQLKFVPSKGAVTFKAIGNPSALTINGEGTGADGTLKISGDKAIEGELKVDLKSFKTGLSLRDRHMRDKYLEVEKFPEAKFTPTMVPWPDPSLAATQAFKAVPFTGKMNLHGVEVPVEGTMSSTPGAGGKVDCEFDFKITLSDFKIETPSFADITVAGTVDVKVKAETEVQVL